MLAHPDLARRILREGHEIGSHTFFHSDTDAVGDPKGWLAGLQELEYVTAQNLDRRAAALIGAIMVVPGAIGAWRLAAVRAAGLYRNDTLTENADLTVAVHRVGLSRGFCRQGRVGDRGARDGGCLPAPAP